MSNREQSKTPFVLQRGQPMPNASDRNRSDRNYGNSGQHRNYSNNVNESSRSDIRRSNVSNGSSSSNARTNRSRDTESYGVIASIKSTFGFIQPIIGEEQIYFSDRDFYDNMKVGDKVGYFPRSSNKGQQAEGVRYLAPHLEKIIPTARGVILRNPDRHRNLMGLLEVDLASLKPEVAAVFERSKEIPFRHNDVVESSIPKHYRMDKGDTVEISISKVHDSSLMFACNVKMLALNKERQIAVQIQRMLDAGAVREMGVVSTLKRGEYGFIRAQDRKEEIYFRMDDAVEEEDSSSAKLVEGSEVEFFVTVEVVKGKMSDRAILLTQIPKGTVKFEVQLASKVVATVIEEVSAYPSEAPGKLRLAVPVNNASVSGGSVSSTISVIELWQRCLPEELLCRVGDQLVVDVQYYRPEKLYFARGVKVHTFRKIGREYGTICSVKEHGFGFISSPGRGGSDLYFKTSHVFGLKGELLAEKEVKLDQLVSFDVVVEANNSGSRVRAQRVRLESPEVAKEVANIRKQVIKRDLLGLVVRNATKKDAPGLLKIHPSHLSDVRSAEYVNTDLIDRISFFRDTPELTKITIYCLPTSVQGSYTQCLAKYFPNITYEIGLTTERDGASYKFLTLSKVSPAEYVNWARENNIKTGGAASVSPTPSGKDKSGVIGNTIQFFKEDYESQGFGPLANDLKVLFDLCWDSNRNKPIARTIRLTDEPVADAPDKMLGIMEVVVEKEKDEPYGFLRCMRTDEKLFWHCSETFLPYGQDLRVGTDVAFMIRRRGGMRCAVDIEVLEVNANYKEETLPETCTGLVVEEGLVVLLNVTASPILSTKYADVKLLHECTQASSRGKPDKGPISWERLGLLKQISDDALGLGDGTETPPTVPVIPGEGESASAAAATAGTSTPTLLDTPSRASAGTPSLTPAPDATPAVGAPGSGGGEDAASEFNIEYKAKYFSAIPRLATPIRLSSAAFTESGSAKRPAVGDIVTCQAVVNLGLGRAPLAVVDCVTAASGTAETATKRRGRIVRMKFRVKPVPGWEVPFVNYSLGTVDFVEILVPGQEGAGSVGASPIPMDEGSSVNGSNSGSSHFYCDSRELKLTSENSRELIQVGDEVDFWTTSGSGNVAFHVVVVPKPAPKEINFKRGAINAELKDVKAKTGSVNLITMAMGPPNDAAKGFEPGWRPAPAVSGLPWAHLLTHL